MSRVREMIGLAAESDHERSERSAIYGGNKLGEKDGRFDICTTELTTSPDGLGLAKLITLIEVKDHVARADEMLVQFRRLVWMLTLKPRNHSEIVSAYLAFLGEATLGVMLGNLFTSIAGNDAMGLDIYTNAHEHEIDGCGDSTFVVKVTRAQPGRREQIIIH